MPRHFLVDTDLTPEEQSGVLDLAAALKADRFSRRPLAGPQTVGIIFDKTSTRTRVSFAAGVSDLGGNPLIINPGESAIVAFGERAPRLSSARQQELAGIAEPLTGTHGQVGVAGNQNCMYMPMAVTSVPTASTTQDQ